MFSSMAFTHSLSPLSTLYSSSSSSSKLYPLSSKTRAIFPILPLKPRRIALPAIACTSPKPSTPPAAEQELLEAIADSQGTESFLPCVRTYENDLARLSLVGAVDVQQALTAAAADGGEAADEHIAAGMPAMVVETVFPGSSDEHSTISTRLFLPARKVKEKARRLKSSLSQDIFPSNSSQNILAMTFRQVIFRQLWNFELVLFKPGTERNMNDLENPREVPPSFAISAPDERVLSVIAEVMCLAALESTERDSLGNSFGRSSNIIFHQYTKPKKIVSQDSSVVLYNLHEDGIVANAKSLLKEFISEKPKLDLKMKANNKWWPSSVYTTLAKLGGHEFVAWLSDHIPFFRLQLNADKFDNVTFEDWKELAEKRWEVLLTHSQMIALTNILDMYYEDVFTMPDKQLSCGAVAKSYNLSTIKTGDSLLKMLLVAISSGLFLVVIGFISQRYLSHLSIGRKFPHERLTLQLSDVGSIPHQSLEDSELEACCVAIIKRIKDSFGWPGEIMTQAGCCAWTGELPLYLREVGVIDSIDSSVVSSMPISSSADKSPEEIKASAQEIASYKVVLTVDGKIVGFQPTSRVAINHWATDHLTRELYRGFNLSPDFIEPGLKINRPGEMLLELLMSVNPDSRFALVRPLPMAEDTVV